MCKLLLLIPIFATFLPLPLSAQNLECPPQGYYGEALIRKTLVSTFDGRQMVSCTYSMSQKYEETARETRIVCVEIEGGRNDETDVAQRCRVVTNN